MTLTSNFSGLGAYGKQRNQNAEDKTHFEDKENRRRSGLNTVLEDYLWLYKDKC